MTIKGANRNNEYNSIIFYYWISILENKISMNKCIANIQWKKIIDSQFGMCTLPHLNRFDIRLTRNWPVRVAHGKTWWHWMLFERMYCLKYAELSSSCDDCVHSLLPSPAFMCMKRNAHILFSQKQYIWWCTLRLQKM